MSAAALLKDLLGGGFSVKVDEGRLIVVPGSGLTDEQRSAIKANKAELMRLLIPPPDAANEAGPVAGSTSRPYRLSAAEGYRAHARPWDDADIRRFQTRAGRIVRLGFVPDDAEDLAERLMLRDMEADPRGLCVECQSLSGHRGGLRCSTPDRAGLTGGRDRAALGPEVATLLQACPGLRKGAQA